MLAVIAVNITADRVQMLSPGVGYMFMKGLGFTIAFVEAVGEIQPLSVAKTE